MDLSPYSGFIADPAKCRLLSVDAKRELVCELSKCPDSALKLLHLHKWTRHDIIQIFCSGFCKDRQYEGLSKKRILHYLFTAISGKSCRHGEHMKKSGPKPNSSNLQFPYKRQRKSDVPVHPVIASTPVTAGVSAPTNNERLCENSACRASLLPADKFCRRCSCCICFKYDDNKDPSLWLCCNSDQALQEESCGSSFHLECAFSDERSGIMQNGQLKQLDGGFYCTYCGKQNDLLGCWKKQLVVAKDARRLDVLCHRIFLSHKMLISTQRYLVLHEVVDTALKRLEGELGPITGLPDKGRGIVGRLAVGVEVQKLCIRAIETLESMSDGALTANSQTQSSRMVPSDFIKLEDISHESVTVVFDLDVCSMLSRGLTGFNLWHRKASEEDYPSNLTGIIPMPARMLVVRGLAPCTSYVIKVVAFTSSKKIGSWEIRTNTIGCPKGLDGKDSMPVDVGKDTNNRSTKENSSGLSNPSSEGAESEKDSTDYADLNSSSQTDVECYKNLDTLYSVKAPHHCNETSNYSRDQKINVSGVTKVDRPDKSPKVPATETLESMLSGAVAADTQTQSSLMVPADFIKIEDISHESVTVVFDLDVCPTLSRGVTGFNLWHRKVTEGGYHSNPTGIIPMPSRMLVVRGLAPCTSYIIKVVAFTGSKKIGSWVVRTDTIGCPKGLDAEDPIPVDVEKDPNNGSTKEKSSGLSNASAGAESDEDGTSFANRNSSSEIDVERCKSLDILYSVKSPHHCTETTDYSRDRKIDVAGVAEVDGPDKAPKVPPSASDCNEEEPGLAAQAALLKSSTELMVCNQRASKQNSGMIGSEIAPHAHTGNKSVGSPEYHGSLLGIIQKEIVNCKEVSGRSFEAKSGKHIPHDDSSKTETDPGCLPWKRTPGRINDGGHEDGPSEPNTSAQVSSPRKSSNLVRHRQGILLENAPGSQVPRAGNGIKAGNRIIGTSSKSNNVPQPGPLKPETEPWSPSSNNPSGKADDIEQTDANAYVFCVKVIRRLECEGYVEANFRVKFLTWLSLRATRHEKKIVSVFVDTFIDDPASLADQLRDTFSEAIYSKRLPIAP